MSSSLRTFTADEEPPLGERIHLMCADGHRLVWTGKRWYDLAESDGSLQTQEAWPPSDYGDGPWFEVADTP